MLFQNNMDYDLSNPKLIWQVLGLKMNEQAPDSLGCPNKFQFADVSAWRTIRVLMLEAYFGWVF